MREEELTRLAVAGGVLAALGVVFGAFGAHALRDVLDAQRLGWWQTAGQYHLPHAVALVAIGLAGRRRRLVLPAWLIAAGVSLFSGSLYTMALTGWRSLGAVTPLGGVLMVLGWALLAWRLSFAAPVDGS